MHATSQISYTGPQVTFPWYYMCTCKGSTYLVSLVGFPRIIRAQPGNTMAIICTIFEQLLVHSQERTVSATAKNANTRQSYNGNRSGKHWARIMIHFAFDTGAMTLSQLVEIISKALGCMINVMDLSLRRYNARDTGANC